jgi:hypothetical protein
LTCIKNDLQFSPIAARRALFSPTASEDRRDARIATTVPVKGLPNVAEFPD